MTMYFARTYGAQGCGVTEAQALAGLASFHRSDDVVEITEGAKFTVTIIEFRPDQFYGIDDAHSSEPEEWARDIREVEIGSDGMERLADRFEALEREGSVANGAADWRVDYGDDDITYVVKDEDDCVVDICEHWDQAKEARDECNDDWDDGKSYWIDEVEGEVELGFTEVEG